MTKSEAEEVYRLLRELTDIAWNLYVKIDNMRDEQISLICWKESKNEEV